MARNKSVLEEALLEAQALEEAVKTNAKEILSSTMKEEIEQLVKESLNDEDEEVDFDLEDEEEEVYDTPDLEQDFEGEEDFDEEPLDLRGASDDEVLKVFKLMGSDDGVIVTQDDDVVDIKDTETGVEYKVELGESTRRAVNELEDELEIDERQGDYDREDESIGARLGKGKSSENERDLSFGKWGNRGTDHSDNWGTGLEEDDGAEMHDDYGDELDEAIYEIELEDDALEIDEGMHDQGYDQGYDDTEDESLGDRLGAESKFRQSDKARREDSYGKWGRRSTHHEGNDPEEDTKDEKEEETNEASRTTGFGSKKGRGLRKGFTNNRNLTFKEGTRRRQPRISESRKKYESLVNYTKSQDKLVEKLVNENKNIKGKVNDYKKALGDFRSKINEVAVFNSNLAYATKLFTEHTTSKEEKINIMRRFDEVQSLNESRSLFKRLSSELKVKTNSLNESVRKKITKSPQGGSTNLIESKIYESPQIARIKDMMTKLK